LSSRPSAVPEQAPRLAFVTQRYGLEVAGGSESLARAVAERLAAQDRVTVLTTCARDYVTWRNELAPGREELNGVEVLRFASQEERDLAAFNAFAEPLYTREASDEEEQEFLRRQGPYVPALAAHLAAHAHEYDAVLFFTYLYYPTWAGLRAAPAHSILVPTAHDEPALRLRVFGEVFGLPRAFAFCSAPEETLARARFSIGDRPTRVTGIGIETPDKPDVEAFVQRHGLAGRPYALYAGRIDAGKGCAEMLDFYARYRAEVRAPVDLLLIGRAAMAIPDAPGVRYLGFVSEDEKYAAMAGARAVLCSSPFESLSIVLLEGWALGTPALVNARSAVLKDHCRRSNAGLYYENADEFSAALDLLVTQPAISRALAANGRGYVAEHYRWPAVLERYRALIDAVSAANSPEPAA
jgi:glycosyltransferase involved in cell wall biosynthesis